MNLAIISNPYCKRNKTDSDYLNKLENEFQGRCYFFVTKNMEELRTACEKIHELNVRTVGILGGDGSISLVLTFLNDFYQESFPRILVLKGGTINFLAQNLRIKDEPEVLLQKYFSIEDCKNQHFYTNLQLQRVNDELGLIFADPTVTHFLNHFYENKTDKFGVLKDLFSTFIDGLYRGKWNGQFHKLLTSQSFQIQTKPNCDNIPHKMKGTFLFTSTVPQMPFGVNFFRKVTFSTPSLELVIVPQERFRLVWEFVKMLAAPKNSLPIVSHLVDEVELKYPENSVYSLDGDLKKTEDGSVKISKGPVVSFVTFEPLY